MKKANKKRNNKRVKGTNHKPICIMIPEDDTVDVDVNHETKTVFVSRETIRKFEDNFPYLMMVLYMCMDNLGPNYKLIAECDGGICEIA